MAVPPPFVQTVVGARKAAWLRPSSRARLARAEAAYGRSREMECRVCFERTPSSLCALRGPRFSCSGSWPTCLLCCACLLGCARPASSGCVAKRAGPTRSAPPRAAKKGRENAARRKQGQARGPREGQEVDVFGRDGGCPIPGPESGSEVHHRSAR